MSFSNVPILGVPGLDRSVLDVTHTGQVSVSASSTLDEAARTMAARRVHAVLVVDGGGTPLGWVTARGMLHNAARDWKGACVRDAISEQAVALGASATVRDAVEALVASGASHLVVRSEADESVLGVVADFDLLALFGEPHGG